MTPLCQMSLFIADCPETVLVLSLKIVSRALLDYEKRTGVILAL